MSGIYIHIPFCKTKCGYCDFYSNNQIDLKQAFLKSLLKEIGVRRNFINTEESVNTIYFGGGTPSQLTIEDCRLIIDELNRWFKVSPHAEITFEANPDDLNPEYLSNLLQIGFNRISIGVQTFDEAGLKLMNRRHNSKQAIDAVFMAQKAGFDNITIDLIYGYPGLLEETWIQNLKTAFKLPIKHLSSYHLIFEEGTPFHDLKKEKKLTEVDESVSNEHYSILCEMAREHGFLHYEISNFCKEGWPSRHNSSYWDDTQYLGLGPSAHSYNQLERCWNISSTEKYIQFVDSDLKHWHSEVLGEKEKLNEFIMTRLRTSKGILLHDFQQKFGTSALERLVTVAKKQSSLLVTDVSIAIPEDQLMVSDPYIVNLFV